jgi:WD40 repeat protein/serine/threonine protein kinase
VDQRTEELKIGIVTALKGERWGEALPLLESWCDRYPGHAKSWLNRGYCLFRLGRLDEAVSAFDRCLELDPGSESAKSWRQSALAGLDAAHTVSQQPVEPPAVTAAAQPALADVTRRASVESQAPKSFATMAIPVTRRGWQAGSVIDGRYEVHATARGGMAVVAIAFDRELWRMVAIKTPLPSMLATADGRARFQREAESWVALGVHPNICCAYYLQEIGGLPRLFIEYVDGGDLTEWLKREDTPGLEEKLDIAIQIASGLDYTNTFPWTDDDGVEHRGLVHRDVKPANVLLTTDGVARVTDFGLVRSHAHVESGEHDDVRDQLDPTLPRTANPQDSVATGSWQTVTAAGGLVGTPPYMAPELWRQSQRGTVATDIYAYGCLLYEVFCGRRPFVMKADAASQTREAHLGSLMRMHLRDAPPDPRTLGEGIDDRLAALMQSCLAKDAEGRPSSFAEIRKTLVGVYEQVAGRPYPRPEPKRTQLLADSLSNRGASFVTLGLVDRAAASFREALEIDPTHLEATFNAGLLEWRRSGLTDGEFERRLSEAESSGANSARAGLLRAKLRLLLDNPVGALEVLDALPEGEGESLGVRRARAFAMLAAARASSSSLDTGRVGELLRSVVEDSPSDLPAMVGFAECCALAGERATADEALTAARALDRDLPEKLVDAVAAHLPGHRVDRVINHSAPVQSLRVADDGRVVVRTAGAEAFIWGSEGDRPDLRIDLGGPARQGRSMAAAGGSLVVCLQNGPLTVFSLDTGRRLRSFRTHPGVATCVDFSTDGGTIASGGSDRALRLWNVHSGECERTLQGHGAFISALAWHPTEPLIATASADGTARLWNYVEGRQVQAFEGHRGPVRSVAFAAGGRVVLTTGQDGVVGVWDTATGANVRFLRGHTGAATVVLAVGGSIAAGGEDGTIRLWSLDTGESQRVIRLANPIHDLAAKAGGSGLIAALGSHVIQVPLSQPTASPLPLVLSESAVSGELARRELQFQEHLGRARELLHSEAVAEAVGPLRKARAVPGYELHQEALDLWSRVLAHFPKADSRAVVELRRISGGRGPLTACGLTPDGRTILVGGSDGSLIGFDARSGGEVFAVAAHQEGVTALAVSGDGELVATASHDGSVRVWQATDGGRRYSFGGGEAAVRSVIFAPGDRAVIAAGDDKIVRVWRLDETARAETLGGCDDAVSDLAVSADGRFLVGGGWDSLVTVWSLRRRVELRRMEGHEGVVHAVAVSPDCRLVASAGDDGTVRLWDLESGRMWRSLTGHGDAVLAVAFTPDARHLLSAGKDASVRLWDVRTGSAVRVVEGHAGAVADLVVDRDGGTAASVGSDGSVRLWFLDWEPELAERGQWDDRVRPFLQVFLRQRESDSGEGAPPAWSAHQLEALLEDLGRRGFGWLAPERVEQELERLVKFRDESRAEEQEKTREQARRRARQVRVAPVKEIAEGLSRNLGLKVAAVAAAVVVVLVGLWSLRSPGGSVKFGRAYREAGATVEGRALRVEHGTVAAYQSGVTGGSRDCGQEEFSDLVRVALNPESLRTPAPDPGIGADKGFRERYANAVNCVGKLGETSLIPQVLQRAAGGLHPKRMEDLLGVLIGIGAAKDPRIESALTDQSETVRHLAALTLVYGSDDHGATVLLKALKGDDRRAVEAASSVLTDLMCLGVITEDEAFETVRRLCQNIDPLVRRNAVRTLALFEDKKPVREVLEGALEDSDAEVAAAAREAGDTLERAG